MQQDWDSSVLVLEKKNSSHTINANYLGGQQQKLCLSHEHLGVEVKEVIWLPFLPFVTEQLPICKLNLQLKTIANLSSSQNFPRGSCFLCNLQMLKLASGRRPCLCLFFLDTEEILYIYI